MNDKTLAQLLFVLIIVLVATCDSKAQTFNTMISTDSTIVNIDRTETVIETTESTISLVSENYEFRDEIIDVKEVGKFKTYYYCEDNSYFIKYHVNDIATKFEYFPHYGGKVQFLNTNYAKY